MNLTRLKSLVQSSLEAHVSSSNIRLYTDFSSYARTFSSLRRALAVYLDNKKPWITTPGLVEPIRFESSCVLVFRLCRSNLLNSIHFYFTASVILTTISSSPSPHSSNCYITFVQNLRHTFIILTQVLFHPLILPTTNAQHVFSNPRFNTIRNLVPDKRRTCVHRGSSE